MDIIAQLRDRKTLTKGHLALQTGSVSDWVWGIGVLIQGLGFRA